MNALAEQLKDYVSELVLMVMGNTGQGQGSYHSRPVKLTPSAKSDFVEIWNYSVETRSEKQSEKYLQDIEVMIINLQPIRHLEDNDLKLLLDITPYQHGNTSSSI